MLVAVLVEADSSRLGYIIATSSSPTVAMTQTKTPVHKQAKRKKKHIIPSKPRKISTNIIHLLKRTVGLSSQKGPAERSEV